NRARNCKASLVDRETIEFRLRSPRSLRYDLRDESIGQRAFSKMIIIVPTEHDYYRNLGIVADYCPECNLVTRSKVVEVYASGRPIRAYRNCLSCRAQMPCNPHFYKYFVSPTVAEQLTDEHLLALTHPEWENPHAQGPVIPPSEMALQLGPFDPVPYWKVQGARPPQPGSNNVKPSWSPGAVAIACWLSAVGCFAAGPLFGLAVMHEQERKDKFRATGAREPERITLRQLVARGADGNAHLAITDFELSSRLIFFADKNRAF